MVISLKVHVILSKCISMICASIFSYITNKNWTFKVKEQTNLKMVAKYIVVQIINISVNTTTNYFVFSFTQLKTISFVVATLVAMIVNYLLQNYIVFKGEKIV